MPDPIVHGSCLCGSVRYEIRAPFTHALNCHCSRCRKFHGAPFASYVAAPAAGFRFVSGEAHVKTFSAAGAGDRKFCDICGSALPMPLPDTDSIVVPMGPIEGDMGTAPTQHIFAASKAPWHPITDDLRQWPEYPGGVPAPDIQPVVRPQARSGVSVGSCLCGEVHFEYEGPPDRMLNCHCSRCRRARAAAHTTNIAVPLDRFRFTRGEPLVREFVVPDAKFFGVAFCSKCGASMPRRSEARGFVVIPAASLDSDPGMRATGHIFATSKARWFEISDALPQYEGLPTG